MKENLNKTVNVGKYDGDIYSTILEMNVRHNYDKNLNAEDIFKKMFYIKQNKKGVYFEFLDQCDISNGRLTPELALLMAEIIFYTSQENCSNDTKKFASKSEKIIGITHELAQEFCLIKYRCRLENPKEVKNYERIEYNTMAEFLNNKNLNFLP